MGNIYKVNTPKQALQLALKFQKEGKYDLFRGQNEDWPLVSSINRLSPKKREEAIKRLFMFKLFLSEYKETRKYANDLNYLMSIAQHYGIPTDFVDFTKSPRTAMFFATHSNKNSLGKDGVIICLNRRDFETNIKFQEEQIRQFDVTPPYIFEKEIDNLWRLKAQDGCFMQLMFGNIEGRYPFDKIIFPQGHFISSVQEVDVYPSNKSELEILLDNYFAAERIHKGSLRLQAFAEKMGIETTRLSEFQDYKYVKSRQAHKSWYANNTKQWKYDFTETHIQRANFKFVLKIKCSGDFDADFKQIKKQLSIILRNIKKDRFIDPFIQFVPRLRNKRLSSLIDKNTKYIWDGMRSLPYTKSQMIYAIAKYLTFEYYESIRRVKIETLIYEPLLIEMTNSFGAHCRYYVSRLWLQWAIREDMLDIQDESLPRSISTDALLFILKARLVFNFNELASLFHTEIIPSLMVRSKHSEQPLLIFSPYYIDILGYA